MMLLLCRAACGQPWGACKGGGFYALLSRTQSIRYGFPLAFSACGECGRGTFQQYGIAGCFYSAFCRACHTPCAVATPPTTQARNTKHNINVIVVGRSTPAAGKKKAVQHWPHGW
ncbi:hypothetical protein ACFOLG_10415 [Vogesella facilis]|uniref:Secreted protein n=1 Tax=Vogesella facilis TaxID=1655232 RepID=A0ABV7RE81_9NEIS